MKKEIKSVLFMFIIILTAVCSLQSLSFHKYTKKPLPEVKLREIKSNKSFAIMIPNESGDGYQEYDGNKWPSNKYKYKEAKCTNNNGSLVENAITFDDETRKATLTTNQTVYCTLYFDVRQIPEIVNQLRENDPNNNLSPDLQGEMYRYQGTDNVPNWICFGTTDEEQCTNDPDGIDKYMYRIIGITENGEIKLIKETFLKEGETNTFTWNDKSSINLSTDPLFLYTVCEGGVCPEWGQNTLFKRLNGISNGNAKGRGNPNTQGYTFTDIFVDSEYYNYLQSGDNDGIYGSETASVWYNLISNHEWLYGDTNDTATASKYNGHAMYLIESGKITTKHYVGQFGNITEESYKWTNRVMAKIGLMYINDYFYSYYDGSNPDSRGNAGSSSKLINCWLTINKSTSDTSTWIYEWLMTRYGVRKPNSSSSDYVDAWNLSARGSGASTVLYPLHNSDRVRPVFYLTSETKIKNGDGTKTNPYILDIN